MCVRSCRLDAVQCCEAIQMCAAVAPCCLVSRQGLRVVLPGSLEAWRVETAWEGITASQWATASNHPKCVSSALQPTGYKRSAAAQPCPSMAVADQQHLKMHNYVQGMHLSCLRAATHLRGGQPLAEQVLEGHQVCHLPCSIGACSLQQQALLLKGPRQLASSTGAKQRLRTSDIAWWIAR